jgi:acyl-CoA synthetase (AMP-forming)/AMP-acid ligase II
MTESIATLADVEALERTPWPRRFAYDNVYDALKAVAAQHPTKVAIYELERGRAADQPVPLTYADFMARIHRTANLFTSLGVGPTDVVSTLLPITPDSFAVMWGAEAAGIGNPINPFLEVEQLEGILRAAGTKVLVGPHPSISPDAWPKIEALRGRLPGLKAVMQVGGPAPEDDAVLHYPACLDGQPDDHLVSGRRFKGTDVAAYFHTGGTTGTPKLARHTHIGQVMQAWTLSLGLGADQDNLSVVGVPLFHVGGVLVRGPQVFAGYVDEAHNRSAYVDGDWLDTGDLGRFDADRYIWLTGRAKDLIIRGGHNIDPAVIEEAMYQHPAVALAAAVGRPDRRLGELPVAYVQTKPGQAVDLDELQAFVRARVTERAAAPVELYDIPTMPVTGVGKIFKPALRLDAAQRAFARELADLDAAVEVKADKVHGAVATIRAKDAATAEAARERMNGFAFRYDVVVVG